MFIIVLICFFLLFWSIWPFIVFFSEKRGKGWRSWVGFLGCWLMLIGGIGFFGSGLSAVGGLNWLPKSFEWPAGYVKGVFEDDQGWHIVPLTPSGRIQIYDAGWKFVKGWPVSSVGGTFRIKSCAGKQIEIFTARGNRDYVFDYDGKVPSQRNISEENLDDSYRFGGISCVVPTRPLLWTFTSPMLSWISAVIGMTFLGIGTSKKKARNSIK